MYICTYMRPCIRPCIHPCIHPSMHPSIHPCIHPSIHSSMHPCMHPCMDPSINASMHPCMHAWMHGPSAYSENGCTESLPEPESPTTPVFRRARKTDAQKACLNWSRKRTLINIYYYRVINAPVSLLRLGLRLLWFPGGAGRRARAAWGALGF